MISHCIRRMTGIILAGLLMMGLFARSEAQSEQRIEVSIKDFTFLTKQIPLRLGLPTVITIKNEDAERHDFGSSMFEGIPTKVEGMESLHTVRELGASSLTRSGRPSFDSIWIVQVGMNFAAQFIPI